MNPNSIVADTEGEMVAWCTKPGHGTRLIPKNALKGVQYMRTPAYAQVVGFIDQTFIDLQTDDYGGEMDPHGADTRGNPLGGLVYSSAFGNGIEQVIEWNNFMGGNAFCIKVCDPANPNAANFCQHIYDRIGCAYNSPNNAQNGTFEACLGDNQDYPGIYTDASGAVQTYTQPPESLGPITTMPYQPKVPASSSCTTYTSSVLYSDLLSVTAPGDTTTSAPASTGTAKPSGSGSASGSKTGTAGGAQNTSNSAEMLVAGGMATAFGVIFSAMFFA
ncbi:hypothetical protein H0H81_008762 [Sphagnurus paluster]|uniref:Macrofage activating glycoprotein n=1 Tax=Sphagnurus paluster TaxID=117069 RepID=A0A9P7KIX9_9AGAR|nr:hypothetical protein H0H81_008762 [Sphagnurus paluster]